MVSAAGFGLPFGLGNVAGLALREADIHASLSVIYVGRGWHVKSSALLCCLLLGISAAAQHDAHFLAARTSAIAHHSAFAHGYLHGYEDGFSAGDLDLQMAHPPIIAERLKADEKASGYRREFGEKRFWETGFRQGFHVGYADAVGGRSFRAVDEVQRLGEPAGTKAVPSAAYDAGMQRGYVSGRAQGLADGRARRAESTVAPKCPLNGVHYEEFCAAFRGAYRMGYADGYVNVARPAVVQAAK